MENPNNILEFGEAAHLEEKELISELKQISEWMGEILYEINGARRDVDNMIEIVGKHKDNLSAIGLSVTESQKDGSMQKIKKHIYKGGVRISDIAATRFYKGKK